MTSPSNLQRKAGDFRAYVVVDGWKGGEKATKSAVTFSTEPFTFRKGPWAIVWSVKGGGLEVKVCDPETSENLQQKEVLNTSHDGQGICYLDLEGTFYLAIGAKGEWVVKIVSVDPPDDDS